jgi:hypothetical protein
MVTAHVQQALQILANQHNLKRSQKANHYLKLLTPHQQVTW